MPFLLIPSYVLEIPGKIDAMSAACLLSILGASNTFGRVLCGILGSKKWVDALLVNNLALLIAGGLTTAIPFCSSYAVLSMFAVGFGICVCKLYISDKDRLFHKFLICNFPLCQNVL